MDNYLIKDATLKNLADEIRRETGKSEPLLGASMTDELRTFSDSLTEKITIQDTDLDNLEAELANLDDKEDLTEEIISQDADLLYLESEFSNLEEKEDLTEEIINQKANLTNLEAELNDLEEETIPKGTLKITENGIYDVTYKARVEVNVAGSGGSTSNKLALIIGAQSVDNLYDITASDLEGIMGIREYSFSWAKGLRNIELPTTCTSIGNNAFEYCSSLTFVLMPNVISIGDRVFANCPALKSLIIPSTCTNIGSYALRCSNKCSFTFKGTTPPNIELDTFDTSNINKIIVPIGCSEAYKTATNWTNFADYIEEATE